MDRGAAGSDAKKTRVAISRNALRRTHITPTAPCTFYVRNRRVTASSTPASVAAGCGIREAPSCRSFPSGRFTRSVFAGLEAVSCGSPTCDLDDRFWPRVSVARSCLCKPVAGLPPFLGASRRQVLVDQSVARRAERGAVPCCGVRAFRCAPWRSTTLAALDACDFAGLSYTASGPADFSFSPVLFTPA